MNPLIYPILSAGLYLATAAFAASSGDPYRVFHDTNGRAMEAVIIRTNPQFVWVRRTDGQTFRIRHEKFSYADREFIRQWKRRDALDAPDAISISVKRYSGDSTTETARTSRTTTQERGYEVTLKNTTGIDLANLAIEYKVYVLRGDIGKQGLDRKREPYTGSAHIEHLPARDTASFKTLPIPLTKVALRKGGRFRHRDEPNLNQREIRDNLGGIWIRVHEKGRLITEFSTPSTLMEDEAWTGSSPFDSFSSTYPPDAQSNR